MALTLELSDSDRAAMLEELAEDVATGRVYESPRLTPAGQAGFAELLRAATSDGDDDWLAGQLRAGGRMHTLEVGRRNGREFTKAVPVTAAATLAEGEFNRLYIRGQARQALTAGDTDLEIFRAKSVAQPRSGSEARVGMTVSAERILADLREHVGIDTALGVPGGPNSGLSARLVPRSG